MKPETVEKGMLIFCSAVFMAAALILLYFACQYRLVVTCLDLYEIYSPANCPNSLWVCAEEQVYFACDADGKTIGAARVNGESRYFTVFFNERGASCSLSTLGNIAYPYGEERSHYFYASVKYAKDRCVLKYDAAEDVEQYFGKRNGKAKLTFVRSNLQAPFFFDDEASLNELPFR